MAKGKPKRDTRALIPRDPTGPAVEPATVGPDVAVPGDPNGVELVGEPAAWEPLPPVPPVQPWSGWPAEWATPSWGTQRLEDLTDIAWMCLDLNSWILSSMPPYLTNAAASLDASWLSNPDDDIYNCWEEFAQNLFWDVWTGEAFILVTARYHSGWPARFHVVEPWYVDVEIGADGLRHYEIGGADIPVSPPAPSDVTPAIIHLPYRATASQAHGRGPLEIGHGRLVAANLLMRYGSNFLGAGAVPTGVLTHPAELTAQQSLDLQNQWLTARQGSLGLPAVLSGGVQWAPTQINPHDLGLVELAQLTESRIAVLMGTVPFQMGLPSGGDSMTYSNVTSLFDYHWRSSLRPKAQRVMRALSARLLPAGTGVELNRDAYVQPGPLERAQTWQILIDIGVLTPDQVAEFERFSTAAPTEFNTSGVLQ